MASTSFRNSMNSLGWSRRTPEAPASTNSSTPILSRLSSFNPFGSGGYVQLPTHEAPGAPLPAPNRREEEEGWFACKYFLLKPSSLIQRQCLLALAIHACSAHDDRDYFAAFSCPR